MLFIYAYRRAEILPARRILYAATLQCLRGMVTGCDNLLDDEYKPTLDTDIPATGHRFRSVVDIMVSDRALFQILLGAARRGEIALEQVSLAATASMKTMTRSGIEEAGEEGGVDAILTPDDILHTVHHDKTGILFQCPWDIPLAVETVDEAQLTPLLKGLYHIGMGCQVMDDMVDMAADISAGKHNYLVSLIHHGENAAERAALAIAMASGQHLDGEAVHMRCFPTAAGQARQTSHQILSEGLRLLFSKAHQALVPAAIRFLEQRIGGEHSVGETVP
jgi:geranylgeranyl pyrophosphate synthase